MVLSIFSLIFTLLVTTSVVANVEKTIFLGPVALRYPAQSATINDSDLLRLSPKNPVLRHSINARLAQDEQDKGYETWVLLQGLTFEKRYEVRVCWAATQPTSFTLDTYELSDVLDSSELTASLVQYMSKSNPVETLQASLSSFKQALQKPGHDITGLQSVLLLRITAAADYFTTNETLMQNVPSVLVDVILDPFTFNALPKSLEKTAVYLIILAILGWYVSRHITEWLMSIASASEDKKDV